MIRGSYYFWRCQGHSGCEQCLINYKICSKTFWRRWHLFYNFWKLATLISFQNSSLFLWESVLRNRNALRFLSTQVLSLKIFAKYTKYTVHRFAKAFRKILLVFRSVYTIIWTVRQVKCCLNKFIILWTSVIRLRFGSERKLNSLLNSFPRRQLFRQPTWPQGQGMPIEKLVKYLALFELCQEVCLWTLICLAIF